MVERIGTICVQGGWRPGDGEPRQVPIYQNTTWKYDTSEHMGRLFDLEESGYFYTRLANPTNDAAAAHGHGVPLIVDNTFPTPVLCRPIEWGADIVTHSTTKYMDGHGASVGGVIVDAGRFDWNAHADKFPGLTTPDESYHGVVYAERFGLEGAYITKATAQLMRDLGSIQSPQNAFLINLGLESLHLRMARHAANGRAVAETFMKNLRLAQIATHVADARTCVLHPANATHRQMNDAELEAAGISADLIRLSCGIEDAADLIADIDQALAAIE